MTVSVRSLTIRNVREGWNALGDIQISDVAIDSCYVGIGVLANPRLIVKQASFSRCEIGVLTAGGSSTATIEDCEFDSGGGGIVNLNSGPVTIARCRFTAMESAIDVEQFSRADISDVVALGIETVGLAVYGGARVTATRCTFGPTKLGISVSSAKLVLTNSKVSAGWNYTFMLSSTDSLVVRGCDILVDPSNQKSIWASAYDLDPYPVLDMRDNYWGLTDSLAIENAIWHDVDDPEIKARVRFSPFRTQSTPSKAASLGRLKARY